MAEINVDYIDHMGSDLTVVNAARVSFDKEQTSFELGQDERLITYLATHGHWTPFSHPQITLRETVPIFIARQRFKHMVGFTYNEISRRYIDNVPDFYQPDSWRSRPDGSLKQGSGEGAVKESALVDKLYDEVVDMAEYAYLVMIKSGVAPEQARMVLPQSMMTSYYVTGSLSAFARMVKQRADSHAQIESQELARQVSKVIEPLFPVSWAALME